jgi:hypothetical protein
MHDTLPAPPDWPAWLSAEGRAAASRIHAQLVARGLPFDQVLDRSAVVAAAGAAARYAALLAEGMQPTDALVREQRLAALAMLRELGLLRAQHAGIFLCDALGRDVRLVQLCAPIIDD